MTVKLFNMIMSNDNYGLFACVWSNKDHFFINLYSEMVFQVK